MQNDLDISQKETTISINVIETKKKLKTCKPNSIL